MAIQANPTRVSLVGNGSQTVFTYPFELFREEDIEVYLDEDLQADGYTVSGVGNDSGGTVTFDVAPDVEVVITLVRNIVAERTTDYEQGGNFKASTVNQDFDRIWAKMQEFGDQFDRTVKLNPTDPTTDISLPSRSTRANKFPVFDDNGDFTVSTLTVTQLEQGSIDSEASALAAAASAGAASGYATDAQSYSSAAAASAADAADLVAEAEAVIADGIVDGSVTIAKLDDAAKPYDIAFIAGFASDFTAEDLVDEQVYGEIVAPRSLTLTGETGYIGTASVGADVQVDVELNGVSIYSVLPAFVASSNTITAGTLSTTSVSAGDRLTFRVKQVGSTTAGASLRFTLEGKLA